MKRLALAAAVASALFAGAAQAAVTEFIIYKEPGFRGDSHTVKGEVAQLEGGFSREAASLDVKGGYWEVCTDHHFKGVCRVVPEGRYPDLGRFEKRIVSVRFLGNDQKFARRDAWEWAREREERLAAREERLDAREERLRAREAREARREAWQERRERYSAHGSVYLYGGPEFRGRSVRIDDNEPDLWSRHFDGRASSVIVEGGTWQLCTEPEFNGRCRVYRPGEYPRLAGLDDRVSSVRRLH